MKKLFPILLVILMASLNSCRRDIIPRADFSVNASVVEPSEIVRFTNLSRDAISYTWDFGDGRTSNEINPVHSYNALGSYTVALTARSEDGRTDVAYLTIDVISYIVADFGVNYNLVQPYEIVHFTNYSQGAVSFVWNFGDGNTSSLINPSHYFETEGRYTVTLTAYSAVGAVDVASISIDVVYTLLDIEVAEYNPSEVIEFIVPGAFVVLYETLADWEDDVNRVVWGETDNQGIITFVGLGERRYWVWAEADEITYRYDNYAFYVEEWYDYIRTPVMTPFADNFYLAWVDYYPDKSRQSRRNKYELNKFKVDEKSRIMVRDTAAVLR